MREVKYRVTNGKYSRIVNTKVSAEMELANCGSGFRIEVLVVNPLTERCKTTPIRKAEMEKYGNFCGRYNINNFKGDKYYDTNCRGYFNY